MVAESQTLCFKVCSLIKAFGGYDVSAWRLACAKARCEAPPFLRFAYAKLDYRLRLLTVPNLPCAAINSAATYSYAMAAEQHGLFDGDMNAVWLTSGSLNSVPALQGRCLSQLTFNITDRLPSDHSRPSLDLTSQR